MRIGITQRVDVVPSYGERRDCLDQQWFGLLESLGLTAVPIPNGLQDVGSWLDNLDLDGFILSGGNDLAELPDAARPAPERDDTERTVLAFARSRRLPVLGVCRGFQMINLFLGGRLCPVTDHVACRHPVVPEPGEPLFAGYREVNSYHGWGLEEAGLAPGLIPCVRSPDGYLEAVRHPDLPWVGIMWHPEREQPSNTVDRQLMADLLRGES